MRDLVGEVLRPSPTSIVVDVGCGTGANLGALSSQYRCIGVDTSAEAIELAKARFPRVQFICGSAPGDVRHVLDRARVVMMMDVLEHVADDFALFSEVMAATNPGTYFLLTVPADPLLWSQHDVSFGHYRRYQRSRLEELWSGQPVRPLFVSHYNSRLFPAIKLVRALGRRRGRAAGEAGTDFRMPSSVVNRLLARVFAGESKRLQDVFRRDRPGYSFGVSLIALLRREQGEIEIRRQTPAAIAGHCAAASHSLAAATKPK
jgi:SAM-dependent methyltransferase